MVQRLRIRYTCGMAAILITVGGCTTVSGYYPNSQVVEVDGTSFMVRKLTGSIGSSWQATPNKPSGRSLMLIDPAIYAANIRAIEKAAGCPVVPGSAQNSYNATIAAVDCSKVTGGSVIHPT